MVGIIFFLEGVGALDGDAFFLFYRGRSGVPHNHFERGPHFFGAVKKLDTGKKLAFVRNQFVSSLASSSNQDLISCIKKEVYMGFWVHRRF